MRWLQPKRSRGETGVALEDGCAQAQCSLIGYALIAACVASVALGLGIEGVFAMLYAAPFSLVAAAPVYKR